LKLANLSNTAFKTPVVSQLERKVWKLFYEPENSLLVVPQKSDIGTYVEPVETIS
jgi:hypothetical protein